MMPATAPSPARRPLSAAARSTSMVSTPGVIVTTAANSANASSGLLNRDRLGKVAGLVHVVTASGRDLAGQHLQRNRGHQRCQQWRGGPPPDQMGGGA